MQKSSVRTTGRSGLALSWPLLTMLLASALSAGWAAWDVYGPGSRAVQLADRPIQDVRVGERVWGMNPHRDDVDRTFPEPDEKTWRLLRLVMHKEDGNELNIQLLRPVDWISDRDAAAGRTIELDLPELGAEGPADVLEVEPCPPIQSGPGQVVTGTFAHQSSRQILNLQVEAEREPIGVTDNHPIWSETRQEFVEAGKLTVGEELLTLSGTTKITAITPRGPPEPVYNLEVHGEHVYHVAQSGVLVHNSYFPSTAEEFDDFLGFKGTRIPDGPGTPGRGKVVWHPNEQTKITFEAHPYDVGAPDWHRLGHFHIDSPGLKRHSRFVPGDIIPGF